MNSGKVILEEEDISRTLARISHEIIEKVDDLQGLVIVGIQTRGVPLSARIAAKIKEIKGVNVPLGDLDITFYRDDIESKGPELHAGETHIPSDLTGKTIVLVDDVLFTGRSIRAAIDHLLDLGRPARIQLAVLLDRGHRELPIRPDYVGKNIPTSRTQRVQLMLQETDNEDKVVLMDGDNA